MKAKRAFLLVVILSAAALLLPCGCRKVETPAAPEPQQNAEKLPAATQEPDEQEPDEQAPAEIAKDEPAGEATDGEQPAPASPAAQPQEVKEVSEGVKWYTDFEAAKKKAAAENKDLVINLSGSDWCYWCQQLEKEVFSKKEFASEAEKKFVFVLLDFPRNTPQDENIKKRNEEIAQELGFQGVFPTIYVANAKGVPYAKTGYIEGGVKAYLNHLKEIYKYRQ